MCVTDGSVAALDVSSAIELPTENNCKEEVMTNDFDLSPFINDNYQSLDNCTTSLCLSPRPTPSDEVLHKDLSAGNATVVGICTTHLHVHFARPL